MAVLEQEAVSHSIQLQASAMSSLTTDSYQGGVNSSEAHPTPQMWLVPCRFTSSASGPKHVGLDISGILTSWSFNDGVQTINNADGTFNPNFPPTATTHREMLQLQYFLCTELRYQQLLEA